MAINNDHALKIGQAQEMFAGFGSKTDLRYRKSAEKIAEADLATALAQKIADVITESAGNKSAIETLNGTGAGSIKKAIDDAFDDFATKISDDGVVNTYKELIDYAASHGAEFTALVGDVSALTAKLTLGTHDVDDGEGGTKTEQYATVKAYVEAYVAAKLTEAALTQGNGITINGGVVSAKVAQANGLSVDAANGIQMALASSSSAGAMSASDKEKLDGIEFATTSEVQEVIDAMFNDEEESGE